MNAPSHSSCHLLTNTQSQPGAAGVLFNSWLYLNEGGEEQLLVLLRYPSTRISAGELKPANVPLLEGVSYRAVQVAGPVGAVWRWLDFLDDEAHNPAPGREFHGIRYVVASDLHNLILVSNEACILDPCLHRICQIVLFCGGFESGEQHIDDFLQSERCNLEFKFGDFTGPHLLPHQVVVEDVPHAVAARRQCFLDGLNLLRIVRHIEIRDPEGDGIERHARLVEYVAHNVALQSLLFQDFFAPSNLFGGVIYVAIGHVHQSHLGAQVGVREQLDLHPRLYDF
mmetsp:Transcript_8202/g.13281  ORF Transcript_8202/g.13281 Transcript_8202/m.13281 type:complete len:283 (+) Transcript_8202:736-1584(+)